jgi:isoleucyl-tRNA synthetase
MIKKYDREKLSLIKYYRESIKQNHLPVSIKYKNINHRKDNSQTRKMNSKYKKSNNNMDKKYKTYKQLDFKTLSQEALAFWAENKIFEQSLKNREGNEAFVFYEGPPSANGKPGIHHVLARAIKDTFCRHRTMKGYYVERKAGWDTHGLPVELSVEKKHKITKEDIGKKISVEDYNQECRTTVMQYKDQWDDLTVKMGYWVDMKHPYITFDNRYIESVWWLLKELYKKGLLYKGYTIQPYSPAAGTGLSSHEVNLPGCYKDVKDQTVVAQFKIKKNEKSGFLFDNAWGDLYFLAWTTTPWTLPSNTALAVGKNITYAKVQTYNPYSHQKQTVILAKDLLEKYFPASNKDLKLEEYEEGQKKIPYKVTNEYTGQELTGISYEQLLPYAQPTDGDAFKVIPGDFVTTADGTGIVHIAPSFGADDMKVAKQNGIGSLTLVNKLGKFTKEMGEFAGRYVKPEYYKDDDPNKKNSVDVDIIVKLKKENLAFKAEKHTHSYPHCWRTDKPILYYPLDSWFIKTTAYKERMIELNNTINWKPKSTGSGRFGNWLENLVDWNLSRSRFWGVPLPIWRTEDNTEEMMIGSAEELKNAIEKSIAAGFMDSNPLADFIPGDNSETNYNTFDFHKPYVDKIILVSENGKKMFREPDLIDVWFDSGSMPYAQLHYPFENKEKFQQSFPADFIAEGVDQTRGWFFTLHAIATMLFDSTAYKAVVSNGLVLDKKGNKMSKRLNNAVDPFDTIEKFGADPTRWYMMTNSQPWDNLKFDINGVDEVRRKFFGTLHNTYSFFALYANIDNFTYAEEDILIEKRPELDRWILSELNTLISEVDKHFVNYEPAKAGRLISEFTDKHLSNWYVRLSRRRFWKGEYSQDKISAYQTLYTVLEALSQLIAPIAPFFADRLYRDLNAVSKKNPAISVHLTDFPLAKTNLINRQLEKRMQLAQQLSSMALSLRKRMKIRVRQPLNKILIPSTGNDFKADLDAIKNLVMSEVNVKNVEVMEDTSMLSKTVKANFKTLGPKYGKIMKQLAQAIAQMNDLQIQELESKGEIDIPIDNREITIGLQDVEIRTQDIKGWQIASEGSLTVALDINITEELWEEGLARELINRIQNIRKEKNFEVTDSIQVILENNPQIKSAINHNYDYICTEILATDIQFAEITDEEMEKIDLVDDISIYVKIKKQ